MGMGRWGGWAFAMGVAAVVVAAGVGLNEWDYRQDNPNRPGVSGLLIALSVAVGGLGVAAALLAREFGQVRHELHIVRNAVERQYDRLEQLTDTEPPPSS